MFQFIILSCPQHRCPWPSLATSPYRSELLYVGSSWSPCFCSAMWRGPWENITYELVPTSPAVSCMPGSSNLDSFRDGWLVTVQPRLCGVLPLGPVQILYSCRQAFSPAVSDHVVHPYSSIDTIAAWKKLRFILSVRSDFHMTDSLLIAVHAFVSHVFNFRFFFKFIFCPRNTRKVHKLHSQFNLVYTLFLFKVSWLPLLAYCPHHSFLGHSNPFLARYLKSLTSYRHFLRKPNKNKQARKKKNIKRCLALLSGLILILLVIHDYGSVFDF